MLLRSALVLILSFVTIQEQNAGERFHQAIRNNDLTALRSLIQEYGVDARDSRRQTPLMLAAIFGSFEATQMLIDAGADAKAASASGLTALHLGVGDIKKVRLLVEHGADIHARSQMGRTPLIVAAYTTGTSDVVRYLLGKGADPSVADASGVTPLIAAASVNNMPAAKLLLDRGVDINAYANLGDSATALMAAAHNGNAELTRLLLVRKASVNVASAENIATVKNGPVQFGSATALHLAALSDNPEIVKLLIEAGARVDAQDVRGMTPLMWSVSTDRPNAAIIRMLMQKGSDLSARSKVGETALDWARKFNNPAVMGELKSKANAVPATTALAKPSTITARAAVARSLSLLQSTALEMIPRGGCVACHAQPVAHMVTLLARARGWTSGDAFLKESVQTLRTRWLTADQPLLQGLEPGGSPDIMLYTGIALAAAGDPPSWNSDVLVAYLLAKQRPEGNWRGIGATRAPIEDGDFSRTAMSIRTLAVFGMPARKPEIDDRIRRAARWLAAQTPVSTEDRVMQLLGLQWAGTNAPLREMLMRDLFSRQFPDGGWSQTPYLASDAYATGEVLYTLQELGVSSSNAAIRAGVNYLLQTQKDDGSWYVKSRAMKIQPYFESGFPYGHDQWISATATAWATMALSRAEEVPTAAAFSR